MVLRRRYRQRLSQLCGNVFKADDICARVDESEAAIRPALATVDPVAAQNQEHQATWFKQRVQRRSEALHQALRAPVTPLKFGPDNALRLTGWKPSRVRSGEPTLTQTKDAQGHSILVIRAGNRPGSGSWRTRAILEQGQYRLEGQVRVRNVPLDPTPARSGAGLRISKGNLLTRLAGTTDWTESNYDFDVEDETIEIEFVCELRTTQGEAWFDETSLRLVRLP